VHDRDKDDDLFILVTGTAPSFRIAGCIMGRDAKRSEFWRTDTGRPAYFVPQDVLTPLGGA
jgi:hypothetical protein